MDHFIITLGDFTIIASEYFIICAQMGFFVDTLVNFIINALVRFFASVKFFIPQLVITIVNFILLDLVNEVFMESHPNALVGIIALVDFY